MSMKQKHLTGGMTVTKKVKCPECHGDGGWTDAILDDGSGPRERCYLCMGIGVVNQKERMEYVRRFRKDFGRGELD